jgi:hypothetical protein
VPILNTSYRNLIKSLLTEINHCIPSVRRTALPMKESPKNTLRPPTTVIIEKTKRVYFPPITYDYTRERLITAKRMIMLGEVPHAKRYIETVDPLCYDFIMHLCDPSYDDDPRPLKFLARFVIQSIESEFLSGKEKDDWDNLRRYYLNQMAKWSW